MHYGEKFANADKSLALEQHQANEDFEFKLRIEVEDVDKVTTYDIACEYFVNIEERFEEHFPHLLPRLKKMRWGIPALHIQGHQDSCMYLFGTAYMECVGHFHGESAEQYWPELNQLGPHVRQMNHASDLADELKESKRKYLEKRNHFIGLSLSFRDRIDQWKTLPRTASKVGKDAVSVYKHRSTKVPSQTAIFQKMLSDDANFGQTAIPRNKVARSLDDGFKIQDSQRKLQRLIADTNEHELVSRRKEIAQRTTKLRAGIDAWRKTQTDLMPKVADKIAGQTLACPEIHAEKLYLPSELTLGEHHSLNLTGLAAEEIRWREAQAFDALRAIQNVVKTLSALRGRKIKNDRQQKQNTRAADNITEATKLRDQHMISYEVARQALLALDAEAALYMKPVLQRRQLCDSHYTDGPLWRFPAPQLEDANEIPSSLSEQDIPEMDEWANEDTWRRLAEGDSLMKGYAAYARQKAAMYQRRAAMAQKLVQNAGYADMLIPGANLIERVQRSRDEEASLVSIAIG
ncbi:CxC2 domain-containing protein [Favolaschia claudopus]|uniref:CxC2 domain-containing protein n=1 Tax=Favolaschia claudopus TaxID=2862362 RepID=A0AAW0BLL8_9AGAR